MDSKRDIRPKLASRLLKDSLVLHCLFRVSLATQHIIGTIIFLKQRKNENKNNVLRIYTRSVSIPRRVCVRVHHVCHRVGDTLAFYRLSGTPDSSGCPCRIRLATRARVSTTNDVERTLKKRIMKIIRKKKSFNCQ